ncbi:MAG: discoidin domain-containing protein, partial [Acidobacteriota bacterium]
ETEVFVEAESDDQDVASVQFQIRVGADPWRDLGAADTDFPWGTTLDPDAEGLSFGDVDLRAVATDTSAKTDPAPPAITATFDDITPPDVVLSVATRVDGGDVTVNWAPDEVEPALDGYHVHRSPGGRLTGSPIAATTYLDPGLADDEYEYWVTAVDAVGNESSPSERADALVFTPDLRQPWTPTPILTATVSGVGVDGAGYDATATITGAGGPATVGPAAVDDDGYFQLPIGLGSGPGTTAAAVRLDDDQTPPNRSKTATVEVTHDAPPEAPTGLSLGASGFDLTLDWAPNPEIDILGYRAFRNDEPVLPDVEDEPFTRLDASSERFSSTRVERAVDGSLGTYWAPSGGDGQWIEVGWPERRLVSSVLLRWRTTFSTDYIPRHFRVQAWNADLPGWVDLVEIRDNDLSTHDIQLPRRYRTDRVRVFIDETVLRFGSIRVGLFEIDVTTTPILPAAPQSYTETVADGTFVYRLSAVDVNGFESPLSEPVGPVDVGDVEP